jgi:Mg-chelatase subunit ChlD
MEVLIPPPIPEQERLPLDYLFMIDNSGSIPSGASREFAREAIKAFAELTEPNDRIAIIAFDENARVLVNRVIRNQEDREAIKQAAERGLTFGGSYTDISQPFLYLSSHKGELIRGRGYRLAVILLTDGKIEPRPPRTTKQAYDDIIASLSPEMPSYTIGLGEREINDKFLGEVTGFILLRDKIANATRGRFYHIQSVNELVEAYFKILRATKEISETKGLHFFTVDESTKKITALVLKKTATEEICTTQDIFIQDPSMQKVSFDNYSGFYQTQNLQTRIGWHQGKYYDMITIDLPFLGKWQISLKDGREPKLVSLLKTMVNLRYDVRPSYWHNEKKMVTAWLYDERAKSLSQHPYKVIAKFDQEKEFDKSHHYIEFQRAKDNIYLAQLKADRVDDFLLQITAENGERFFYRMSEPISFNIRKSYFDFSFPAERVIKSKFFNWIMGWKGISFNTVIDTKAKNYIPFQKDPEVFLHLERIDEKGKRHPLPPMQLEKDWKEGKISYTKLMKDFDLENYSGHYQIKGTLQTGERIEVASESFSFEIKRPWLEYVVLGLIGLAIVVFIIWFVFWKMDWKWGHPRLIGSLNIISPTNYPQRSIVFKKAKKVKAKKMGRGGEVLEFGRGKEMMKDLQATSFRLEAYYGRPNPSDYQLREKKPLKKIKKRKLIRFVKKEGVIMVKASVLGKEKEIPSPSPNIYNNDKITFTDGGRNFEIIFSSPKIRL